MQSVNAVINTVIGWASIGGDRLYEDELPDMVKEAVARFLEAYVVLSTSVFTAEPAAGSAAASTDSEHIGVRRSGRISAASSASQIPLCISPCALQTRHLSG